MTDGGHQIDWPRVAATRRPGTDYTITANGGEAAGATSITVAALPIALEAGVTLDFGEHSGTAQQMLAKTTAYAAAGATEIPVEPLGEAVEDTAEATYTVATGASKQIAAGTIMAQLASGKMIPRADVTGAETAIGVLATDAAEGDRFAALTGYGIYSHGSMYEELLPDNGAASFDTWIGEINTAGVGSIVLKTYSDNTGS
jgi:hypothetical protein